MVFDDEGKHWKQAKEDWDDRSCDEMLHDASFAMPLDLNGGTFNRTASVHEKIRPRFWYFTFAACGVQIAEPVSYEIHAENILQGFQSEFGIDERGSLLLQFVAFLFFFLIAMCLRGVARRATGAEALRSRPLLRLLIGSTVASAASAACLTVHFLAFSFDGWGSTSMELLGAMLACLAKALLTVLQLLTAKGWALFYSPEELLHRRVLLCMVFGIIVISMSCEIHSEFYRDWSTDIYLYESWPGLLILFLNMMLFVEAYRSMRETYKHETSQEVRVFYAVISSACVLYFLTTPFMCILAGILSPWSRAKWVARAEVFSRLLSTALLAWCLRPSRLDAMVSARLEEGLETLGEPRDDDDDDEQGSTSPLDRDLARREPSDDEADARREGLGRAVRERDKELLEPLRPAE